MKYLSIIAFLAMVIFFTLWSMYEDRKKQVIAEDFSTGLLQWNVVEESDSTRILFRNDTLEVVSPGRFTAWFDQVLPARYQIVFSFSLQSLEPESDLWRLDYMWGAGSPDGIREKPFLRLAFFPGDTRLCQASPSGGEKNECSYFHECLSARSGVWNRVKIHADESGTRVEWNGKEEKFEEAQTPDGYFGFSVGEARLCMTGLEIRTFRDKR